MIPARTLALALVCVIGLAYSATAGDTSTATFDATASVNNSIKGEGTYQVKDGWEVKSIIMYAVNRNDNTKVYTTMCSINKANQTFEGSLLVPAGSYDSYVKMETANKMDATQTESIKSNVVVIKVGQ